MKSLVFTFVLLLSFFGSNQSAWCNPSQVQPGMDEKDLSSVASNPSGDRTNSTSLVGVWQRCKVWKDSLNVYHINRIPLLKFISTDNTVMNIAIVGAGAQPIIVSKGKYQQPSDNIYIEYLDQDKPLEAGEDNKIRVRFLQDDLVELDFSMPKYTTKEYWVRVTGVKPNSQLKESSHQETSKSVPMINANRDRYKKMNLPKSADGIKNKSLVGIWQMCRVAKNNSDNYLVTSGNGLKIISNDRTFKNIMMTVGTTNSVITMQGNYEQPSDSIYIESLSYSLTPVFPAGVKNEIRVKFLHDNLIQLTFNLPGQGRRIDEYWVRVTTPKTESLIAN